MKNRVPSLKSILTSLLVAISIFPCFSQTDNTHQNEKLPAKSVRFSLGADLASRYIWRGKDYGNSPAIQPNVSFSLAGFKIGAWGSYGFIYNENSGNYAEFDPYISYTWKWFTVGITDYFFPSGLTPNNNNRYFNYDSKTTGHTFEGCLTFNGPEKFPLQVFAGTHFYGSDKGEHPDGVYDTCADNNYSTYFEISYPFTVKGIGVKPFIGGIPFGSCWYGPYGGVVNAGLTVSKSIRISKEYDLPVFTSVISNPQAQSVFLVFGISL
ncbi:MAG TPA: TorF family putative porin [Bacteroidales bacterium]|nr:TorF family putative porin [Bacteroidales bacterium]